MMHPRPRARLFRRLLVAVLLAGLGVVGLVNGVAEWNDATGNGQRLATITEIAYGLLGFLAAGSLLWQRSWAGTVLIAWSVVIAVTAGMAPVVWGGAGIGAALAAGGGTALIAFGIVWLGRRALAA